MAWKTCLLLLACAAVSLAQKRGTILGDVPGPQLGPRYELQTFIPEDLNIAYRNAITTRINASGVIGAGTEVHYEWENYDGWYNNPAHPEWGGAGE